MRSKDFQGLGEIRNETIVMEKAVDRKNQWNRILIKREKMMIRPRQVECPA